MYNKLIQSWCERTGRRTCAVDDNNTLTEEGKRLKMQKLMHKFIIIPEIYARKNSIYSKKTRRPAFDAQIRILKHGLNVYQTL